MLVHLTGSTWSLGGDLVYMRKISHILHELGVSIARDWIETANHRHAVTKVPDVNLDMQSIFEENIRALKRADAIIMESTTYSFFQGYQLAETLRHKKPMLILSRYPIKGRIFYGIKSPFLTVKEYKTEDDLDEIVRAFISAHTIKNEDLQFKVSVGRQLYSYVSTISKESGRSPAEILTAMANEGFKRRILNS